jgi:hypothetical protein
MSVEQWWIVSVCSRVFVCVYLKKKKEKKNQQMLDVLLIYRLPKRNKKKKRIFLFSWVPMSSSSVQFNWQLSRNK